MGEGRLRGWRTAPGAQVTRERRRDTGLTHGEVGGAGSLDQGLGVVRHGDPW